MLKTETTAQFKKDYKLAHKRGLKLELLKEAARDLAEQKPLKEKYNDHPLTGQYKGSRELHILPNWLLVYKIKNNVLVLERTGSHPDLF